MYKDSNWKQISSVYIGTVIGAGFASGQEILQFFANFGIRGMLGALISTLLFIAVATTILLKVHNERLENYQQLIIPILGKRLSIIVEILILSYLFIGVCVMVAGSGALFYEQFNLSFNLGLIIMAILTLVTILNSVKGILTANTLLIPILLFGIITIGILVIMKEGFDLKDIEFIREDKGWLMSSIMYVNYNIISAIVVLASLLPVIDNKKTAIKGGIMGGLGLGILSIFIILPILILFNEVKDLEIPMLEVSNYVVKNGGLIYSFLIWIAMFTTAVSNSFGFITRICDIINVNNKLVAVIFCTLTIPIAKMGFAKLVNVFYPLFGYISTTILIIFIIISIYKKATNKLFNIKR